MAAPIRLKTSAILEGVGSVVLTPHDADYLRPGKGLFSNGTPLDQNGAVDTGVPRWGLADGQRVRGIFDIPVGWNHVAVRWECCNETAVTGTVQWQMAWRKVFSIIETDLATGAMTNIPVPAFSVGADQHASIYATPAETANMDVTPFNLFGNLIYPGLELSLTRVAGGTLAGLCGVTVMTMTRVD